MSLENLRGSILLRKFWKTMDTIRYTAFAKDLFELFVWEGRKYYKKKA
jgi:hypothetical protein